MARRERVYLSGHTYHVVQRGNNRQAVFLRPGDYIRYQDYLLDGLLRYGVFCHAWVQMTNHVHLLLSPGDAEGISRLMSLIGNRYVQYFNHRYRRTGTLWEGRHRSCVVNTERYLWACYRYIEMNPVRAGLVPVPDSYYWSSYACNALGQPSELVTPHASYLGLATGTDQRLLAYRQMFERHTQAEDFDEIRGATRSGVALGSSPGPMRRAGGGAFFVADSCAPRYH
jgi:putative transposase